MDAGPAATVANVAGRDAETLGQRLARLRRGRRMSLRTMAMRVGCDHALVLRWERDTREPSIWDLVALARVHATTPDALIAGAQLPVGRTWSSRAHPASRRRLLGAQLAAARRRRRLDPWDVYEATGIPGSRLLAIEHGADPSLEEARRLAAMVGMSLAELLMRIGLDTGTGLHRVGGQTQTDPSGSHRGGSNELTGPFPRGW
jgi:transcriptional regulator with XRE-family HTH domain